MEKDYNPYKSLYVPDESLWEQVKEKAGRSDVDRSISRIVCRLLEMWIKQEVIPYPESNDNG